MNDKEYDEDITCCGLWPSAKKPASQSEVDEVKAELYGKNNKDNDDKDEFA